jgi:hypothetical protein
MLDGSHHGPEFRRLLAAKMASSRPSVACIVVWGGGIHYFFNRNGCGVHERESYLMDHDLARCSIFGVNNVEEPELWPPSAETQGWLESLPADAHRQRKEDSNPIEDLYILLEYGTPKSARVFLAATGPNA